MQTYTEGKAFKPTQIHTQTHTHTHTRSARPGKSEVLHELLIVVCQKKQHAPFERSSTSTKAAIEWSLLIVLAIQLPITHEENKESWHNNLSTLHCVQSVLQ